MTAPILTERLRAISQECFDYGPPYISRACKEAADALDARDKEIADLKFDLNSYMKAANIEARLSGRYRAALEKIVAGDTKDSKQAGIFKNIARNALKNNQSTK